MNSLTMLRQHGSFNPPYVGEAGKRYRHRIQDYAKLGDWCQNRKGLVIVCENEGASWLPFKTFHTIKATPSLKRKSYSAEVIWTE